MHASSFSSGNHLCASTASFIFRGNIALILKRLVHF
jgi:predicted ATP-dependent Lon-type protease